MSRTATRLSAVLLALSLTTMLGAAEPEIGVEKGQMYPDFLLPDLQGKLHRLSDHRGKKVLLLHFASW